MFDEDNTGTIDEDEFFFLLRYLEMDVSLNDQCECILLLQALLRWNTRRVSESALGRGSCLMSSRNAPVTKSRTTTMFDAKNDGHVRHAIDVDSNFPSRLVTVGHHRHNSTATNHVDRARLSHVAKISERKQERLFKKYDKDKSGYIEYPEFKKIWLHLANVKKELTDRGVKIPKLATKRVLSAMLEQILDAEEERCDSLVALDDGHVCL